MKFFLFGFLLCSNIIDLNGIYFQCDPNLPCGCGEKSVEINTNRIINGEEAIPSSWSMIVSIRFDFFYDGNALRHACGGTILTDWYILTSASCLEIVIENIQTANVTIAAGIHRRSQPRQIIRDVDDVIIHPNWTGSAWASDFDIALLHLSEPLDILENPLLTRTCIPSQIDDREQLLNYPSVNTTLAVIGWGRISSFGDDSDALRQMIVVTIDPTNPQCMQIIPDSSRQLCAGAHLDSHGPCYGDFGGPIFQWKNNHWEQVGITSYTQDGCKKTTVISYTRLAYFRNWIDENLQNSNDTIEEIPITTTVPTTTEKPPRIYHCDRNTVSCGCGRRNVRLSSKNSTEAIPHSWTTIVSIRLNNQTKHSCTGTILSESFILTSASCLFNATAFGITILASIHNHSDENANIYHVDRIYFHPKYRGFQIDQNQHDIAILHLTDELIFENNLFLSRICLPERLSFLPDSNFYPQIGASLVTVGWGLMNCPRNNQQDLLQQIGVTVQDGSQSSCYILNDNRVIQFCAGLNRTETDTCVRDPGSPVFEWLQDRWQQVGITTYGIACKQFQNQGIYTRLIDYIDWIHSIINTCTATMTTISVSSTTPWIQPITTKKTTTLSLDTTTRKPSKPPQVYNCNSSSTCGCGSVPVVLSPLRIVGGENVLKYSWPMMVTLRWPREDTYWCGGTILSKSYILTAAHCVQPYNTNPPQNLWITAGITDRTDSQGIQRAVDYMHIHPNFTNNEADRNHDIALLHLNEPLPLENKLLLTKTCIHPLPASISNEDYLENGTRLTVIGWGKVNVMAQDLPTDLQQVEVHAIHNDEQVCKNSIHDPIAQFCAGLTEGGKDACGGDSGGPIFKWTGQYWEQVGIVSYGHGCADPLNPGIYTRLSYYYDWINDILKTDNEHTEPQLSSDKTSVNPASTRETTFDSTTRTQIENQSNITTTVDNEINNNNTGRANSSFSSARNISPIYSYHILLFFIYILFDFYYDK